MKKLILAISIFLIILSSCSILEEYAQKPSVKFKTMKVREPGIFDATLVFVFEIDNPNPIGGRVSSASYDLKIDGANFVDGTIDKGINLPASGKADFEVPVHINYLDFFGSASQFAKKDEVDYKISGDFTVLAFKIPYSKTGKIDIPELPEVKLKKVRTNNISLTGGEVVFVLEMQNKSRKPVNLKGLDYNIKLGNVEFGQGESTISKSLNGGSKTTIELPLDVDLLQLGSGVANLLRGDESSYKISGNMELEVPGAASKKFPFERGGNVDFE